MKRLIVVLFALVAGVASAAQRPVIPAPEFRSIARWINTEPLRMSDLRGKVVLVDFWTFECSNCLATLPHLKKWHADYADKGLVVIGMHSPEYSHEKDWRLLRQNMKRLGIEYPVAQDNELATFESWDVKVWPTSFLIDKDGNIVLRRIGEGHYEETEAQIRTLLGL